MVSLAGYPAPLVAMQLYIPLSSLVRFFRCRIGLLSPTGVSSWSSLICKKKFSTILYFVSSAPHLPCPVDPRPGCPPGNTGQLSILPFPLLHPGAGGLDSGRDGDADHVHVLYRGLVCCPLHNTEIATCSVFFRFINVWFATRQSWHPQLSQPNTTSAQPKTSWEGQGNWLSPTEKL